VLITVVKRAEALWQSSALFVNYSCKNVLLYMPSVFVAIMGKGNGETKKFIYSLTKTHFSWIPLRGANCQEGDK
jgi:hypothetical protein